MHALAFCTRTGRDNEYTAMKRQFPFSNDIKTDDKIWCSDSEIHGSSRSRSHSLSDIRINEEEEVNRVRNIPNHNHTLEAEDYFFGARRKVDHRLNKRPVTMPLLY